MLSYLSKHEVKAMREVSLLIYSRVWLNSYIQVPLIALNNQTLQGAREENLAKEGEFSCVTPCQRQSPEELLPVGLDRDFLQTVVKQH